MKKLILLLLLTGCATTEQPIKTVYVDKPVYSCPAPPTVPQHVYEVDKLTDKDKTDPGKVAQAYKADMLYLRKMEPIYRGILKQYEDAHKAAEKKKNE